MAFPFHEGEIWKKEGVMGPKLTQTLARQIPLKSYSLRIIFLWVNIPTFGPIGQQSHFYDPLGGNPTPLVLLGRGHASKTLPGKGPTSMVWGNPIPEVLRWKLPGLLKLKQWPYSWNQGGSPDHHRITFGGILPFLWGIVHIHSKICP